VTLVELQLCLDALRTQRSIFFEDDLLVLSDLFALGSTFCCGLLDNLAKVASSLLRFCQLVCHQFSLRVDVLEKFKLFGKSFEGGLQLTDLHLLFLPVGLLHQIRLICRLSNTSCLKQSVSELVNRLQHTCLRLEHVLVGRQDQAALVVIRVHRS